MTERGERPSGRRSIRARVFALVGLGMLAPLGVMAWGGWVTQQELQRRLLAERELVARHSAERLASVVSSELEALHELASAQSGRLRPADLAAMHAALRQHRVHRHQLFDELFVLDAEGELLASEPAGKETLGAGRHLVDVARGGRSTVTDLVVDSTGRKQLFAVLPVDSEAGELSIVLCGAIDATGARFLSLLRGWGLEPQESIDVLDSQGTIIASTDLARIGRASQHPELVAELIRGKRAASGDCYGCQGELWRRDRDVFAFYPLSIVHWGVLVRQPQSQAHAFVGMLLSSVAGLSLLLFALALLFAWGAALSVTRPLKVLTHAADRIKDGELSTPIPRLAADEVGGLGEALETMRVALRDSRLRIERANEELEQRVGERTAQLEAANRTLKEQKEARTVALRKVISAQEDERKRIARELHDETSQSLAALAMALQSTAPNVRETERKKLDEAAALAVRTLDEVHRLIVDLRPSVLDDLGLQSAIRWYADRYLKPKNVSVRCEFAGMEGRLPMEIETSLFRTAQEAMTNVARHARADTVLLQCTRRGQQITMEIEDDGIGFQPESVSRPDGTGRGLGLLGMRERMELLGGSLEIESAPGQGTRVAMAITVPGEGPRG